MNCAPAYLGGHQWKPLLITCTHWLIGPEGIKAGGFNTDKPLHRPMPGFLVALPPGITSSSSLPDLCTAAPNRDKIVPPPLPQAGRVILIRPWWTSLGTA